MTAKELKEWVKDLPDDALIYVLPAPHMDLPIKTPVIYAIDSKSIEQSIKGTMGGKVISSIGISFQ